MAGISQVGHFPLDGSQSLSQEGGWTKENKSRLMNWGCFIICALLLLSWIYSTRPSVSPSGLEWAGLQCCRQGLAVRAQEPGEWSEVIR